MRSYTNLQTETTIAAGISAAATTITLAHYWWNYPTANFTVTLSDQDATPNQEVVLIESRSGNTLTVAERGWDGTTAKAFDSGDAIECVVVAADFRHLNTNYIGHTTLTSSATSISVSSIPAGYEALRVVFSLQSDRAANALDGAIVQVGNGTVDTGANYSYYMHEYDISTSSSTNVEDHGADTSWRVSRFSTPAALQTSLFGSGELIIHGYADAQGPSARWHTGVPGTDPRESIGWGAWNDTTNAIDIITFKPHTGTNFVAGSEVTVYGVNSALELDGFSGARVYHNTTQSIGTGGTIVAWNSEDFDTDTYHDTSTNNSRLTVPADGYYLVGAYAQMESGSTWDYVMVLQKNGTTTIGNHTIGTDTQQGQGAMSTLAYLAADEYVELKMFAASGAKNLNAGPQSAFWIHRVHSSGAVKLDDLTDVDTTTTTPSTGHVLRHNGTDWVPHSLGTTLIEEVTLSADGTITFSNIPDHYEDLLIVGRSRTSTAVNTGSLTMRVGSGTVDSGSTSYRYGCAYFLSGSTADGFLNSAGAAYGIAVMHIGGNATAGMFSAVEIRIHNYANTDYNRSWLGTSSGYGDSAASGSITSTSGGEWIDTTDPIDIIELSAEDGATDLEAGSRFALYGVSTAGASTSFSGARVRLTADEVIGTGSTVDVDWDEADFDTDTYWEGVTNPERLTVPADGYYYFTANARWDSNATGVRAISLRVNGTDVEFGTEIDGAAGAGDWLGQNTGGPLRLSAGDYVTCRVYQNSGGDLNVDYTTYTDFSVVRLHSSGAVKLDDLTDVDTTSSVPAGGNVLTWDGNSSTWKPGMGLNPWTPTNPIDLPKGSADTPDDEFNSSSLDAKWTAVNGSSGTVDFHETGNVSKYDLSTRPGWVLMQAGSAGTEKVDLRQDYTVAVGASIVAKFSTGASYDGSLATDQDVGFLCINDTDSAPLTGNRIFIGASTGTTVTTIISGDSVDATLALDIDQARSIYLRIDHTATATYSTFFSIDGTNWQFMDEETLSAAGDNVWITAECLAAHTGTLTVKGYDWIRLGTTDVDPWPINWQAAASLGFSGARVYNNANIALNTDAFTPLTFNTERFDTDSFHSTSSNTGRLTVPAVGKYLIGGHVQVTASPGTNCYVGIREGGSTFWAVQSIDQGAGELYGSISTVVDCPNGTEYFELIVFVSNASKNALYVSAFSPEFWIHRLHSSGAVKIDDLTDVDMVTTAPATGDLLRYDGTDWVPATSAFWTADVDDPLTSLTDITSYSGTWSINTYLQCVVATSTACRAFSDTPVGTMALAIVECEFEIPTTFSSSNELICLGLAPTNGSTVMVFGLRGDDKAYFEMDAQTAVTTASYTMPAAGNWVKVRLFSSGHKHTGYIDGVRVLQTNWTDANQIHGADFFPFVKVYSVSSNTVRYRNLKAWSPNGLPS